MVLFQSANLGVPGLQSEAAKTLRPVVDQLVQCPPCLAAGRCILEQPETGVVILVHPIDPPIEGNLAVAGRTENSLQLTSPEELNGLIQGDEKLVGVRSDLAKAIASARLTIGLGN